MSSKIPDVDVRNLPNGGVIYQQSRDARFANTAVYNESIITDTPPESGDIPLHSVEKAALVISRNGRSVVIDNPQLMAAARGAIQAAAIDGISPKEKAAFTAIVSDAMDDGRLNGSVPNILVKPTQQTPTR